MPVFDFRLKKRPTRKAAKAWLAQNGIQFPPASDLERGVGPEMFHRWRFVQSLEGPVYFANCIEPGISAEEVLDEIREAV